MYSLILCAVFYLVWAYLLPKWKGYSLRQELIELDDGAQSYLLRRVPYADLPEWDATHDATGRLLEQPISGVKVFEKDAQGQSDDGTSDDKTAAVGDVQEATRSRSS